MNSFQTNFWDERFSTEEYIYGTEPNRFFKTQIDKILKPGKLLLPGEGEGRNAVYAASMGWYVDAFDQSSVAKRKSLKLAEKNEVRIRYTIADLRNFMPIKNYYDAAAVIFVHLDPHTRKVFHKKIIDSLKPNGKIVLELFSKQQLGKSSGGPQDLSMLCSLKDIKNDFKELETILLEEKLILLNEGDKHSGEASVIRFVGEKSK